MANGVAALELTLVLSWRRASAPLQRSAFEINLVPVNRSSQFEDVQVVNTVSVDFKKLRNFIKIVDAGSMSRASSILRTAQPALSQQIAALERHFHQPLLIRSNQGIRPTEGGLVLYQHAQLMLKQLSQAETDVTGAAKRLTGHVSVGLATYSSTNAVSIPLLEVLAERHPGIVVYINDSFGFVLSELIMTGQMDMALAYGSEPIKGVSRQALFQEELVLVAPRTIDLPEDDGAPLALQSLDGLRLLLPSRRHFLRQQIEASFARTRTKPLVTAEIESVATLGAALASGLGCTILPWSAAEGIAKANNSVMRRLTRPVIEAPVSLCVSDHLPLSQAAVATRAVLLEIVTALVGSGQPGLRRWT